MIEELIEASRTPRDWFVDDSVLEGTGFEPLVPLPTWSLPSEGWRPDEGWPQLAMTLACQGLATAARMQKRRWREASRAPMRTNLQPPCPPPVNFFCSAAHSMEPRA